MSNKTKLRFRESKKLSHLFKSDLKFAHSKKPNSLLRPELPLQNEW